MGKQHIIGVLLALLVVACEQPVPRTDNATGFYDVSAYLKKQKAYLQKTQPKLLKTVQTGNQPPETETLLKTDWEDELAIFEEADLRKPSLRDYYTRQEQELSDGSLSIRYDKIEDAEAPIEYLHLQLTPDRTLHKLEAAFLDKNVLFYSSRKASLTVNEKTGNIESYRISGIQKLIFGDSLQYTVQAQL